MRKLFDHLLDNITESRSIHRNPAALEKRVEVLEFIVQRLLLALAEESNGGRH